VHNSWRNIDDAAGARRARRAAGMAWLLVLDEPQAVPQTEKAVLASNLADAKVKPDQAQAA